MRNKLARQSTMGEFKSSKNLRHWIDETKLAAASGKSIIFSVRDLETAWSPRFETSEIEALVIPRRTLARRKATDALLTQEEADRAFRLAQIQMAADRVFGNPDIASRWLRTQNKRLSGQTPLSVLSTEAGAALVNEMLVQIDFGMFV